MAAYQRGFGRICDLSWGLIGGASPTQKIVSMTLSHSQRPSFVSLEQQPNEREWVFNSYSWVLVNPTHLNAWQESPDTIDLRYHAPSITHALMRAGQKASVTNACGARTASRNWLLPHHGYKMMAVFQRTIQWTKPTCGAPTARWTPT